MNLSIAYYENNAVRWFEPDEIISIHHSQKADLYFGRMPQVETTLELYTKTPFNPQREQKVEIHWGGMLLLTGFTAAHPSFPKSEQAMDALESWAAGHIVGDTFVVSESFRRTPRSPELPLFCLLPAAEGEAAVSTVDAAGRRRVFRWVND